MSHVHLLSGSRVLIALLLYFVPCTPFCVAQCAKASCRMCVGRRRWGCRLFFVLFAPCDPPPLTVITVRALGSVRSLRCSRALMFETWACSHVFPFFECLAALCSQSSSLHARLPKCLPEQLRSMGVASVLSLLWLMPSGASLHLSPPRGAVGTPEGSNFSAPEGGKFLAGERGITLTPEGGTLACAPEGGKFPLPASFLSRGAARFDSCRDVRETWPFLCFRCGIPLLLALFALTRMKWTKKKNRCVVAARKAGKSRFRQKRRSSRCVFVIDLHIWPVLLGVPCNRYVFSSRNPLFKLRSKLVVKVISPHEWRKLLRMMRAYRESKAEDVSRVVGDPDERHSCSLSHASSAWRALACNSPDVIAGGTGTRASDVAGWVDSDEELQ